MASNHDRVFYARDVCFGSSFRNVYLLERLKHIDDALRPDYVISWSEINTSARHSGTPGVLLQSQSLLMAQSAVH